MTADIVYVDDEPAPLLAAARAARIGNRIIEFLPDALGDAQVQAAGSNLWVFDFFNDPIDDARTGFERSTSNGLSIFQQFRYLVGESRPPAVLISNDLQAAVGGDVDVDRRHIMAEQLGVEWIAHKAPPGGGGVLPELTAIADAVKAVRGLAQDMKTIGPADYVAEFSHRVLALSRTADWTRLAVRDVATWRPPSWPTPTADLRPQPVRDTVPIDPEQRAARAIVAWLIRQVLPYASFLVSRRHVAVRLGLSLACLDAASTQNTALRRMLRKVRYKGILADLPGERWWGAGIDQLAWQLPRESEAKTAKLAGWVSPAPLAELGFADPVVLSNSDLVEIDEIAPAVECVRASDEHFPPHAPPAWVRIEDARQDRALARKVRLEDQESLEQRG